MHMLVTDQTVPITKTHLQDAVRQTMIPAPAPSPADIVHKEDS